jgi:integrase
MSLTDARVRTAKSKSKNWKLYDQNGLYVLVTTSGRKYFRLKCYFQQKERVDSLGVYPEISLAEARESANRSKAILKSGIDPVQQKRREKLARGIAGATTFQLVAVEWLEKFSNQWVPDFAASKRRSVEIHLFPYIGQLGIADITVPEILAALRVMENAGRTALLKKVKTTASQVFQYAIATGRATIDPTASLRRVFRSHAEKHYFAVLSPEPFGQLLAAIETYSSLKTRIAMLLLAHTFVRQGELRGARWSEFDLTKRQWIVPAERMKNRIEHLVPLSNQVLELLAQLKYRTGNHEFLFPGEGNAAFMSENTVNKALAKLGYKGLHCGHGFRRSASTMLNELGQDAHVIELQLSHLDQNKIRAAYNQAKRLNDRTALMQTWSDYIDGLSKAKRSI